MREYNYNYNMHQRFEWSYFLSRSGLYRHFADMIWRPFMKAPARSSAFFIFLIAGAFVFTRVLYTTGIPKIPKKPLEPIAIPLDCTAYNLTRTCPSNYPTTFNPEEDPDRPSLPTCPEYFRWIHEDLRPWAHTGITRDMLERAKATANFRLVIVKGKAYVERFQNAFQTRDVFTLWGILQLLRRYPGKIPDLELMFDCVDWPVIKTKDYQGPNSTGPPPLFRYCGDDDTLDIVFPDWSFWGWAEVNIKPWKHLLNDLKEGNKRMGWMAREPYAYWKGNPSVALIRQELMKCNVSDNQDWNARVYALDWVRESQEGYKQSNLASHCNYRYKIYIEGSAWSVSEKYILACDSVSLLVKPHYYDFFTRGLMPVHHYWPVRNDDKCKSIKFAVDWGNNHKQKAQGMGKAASEFIQEDLKMEYVYDYMFHLLNEYAKRLTFKPIRPREAVELCAETMACPAEGVQKKFFMESMENGPTYTSPCTMPQPYDPPSLHALLQRKENSIKQVELWEKNFWENQNKQI
ncbi:O-glucosyltransferase rumi homolog isoform X2 [Quercus lobata]|uniref:O-glucosyltransferase rumi homolog isoform X2 n=1 Tax=Quercus lobata TaxID=97700 RepID=UPI0012473691|nr:O-glucosyltransferase rumi homolog isoform X2 [Quercus lobata]